MTERPVEMPPLPDDDMRFGGDDFTQPDSAVPDNMLDMGGDELQFDMNPAQLGLPGAEIEAPVAPGIDPDPEEMAGNVETVLLNLLGGGNHDTILQMAGERPATAAVASRTANLRLAYAQAVRFNPALRWYVKFASLLPAEKFGVAQGSLRIAMPAPMFRKVVGPFMGEFGGDRAEQSPIVAAVRNMAASVYASDLAAKQTALAGGLRRQSNVEASDFDVAGLGMDDNQVADLPQTAEGQSLEPMRAPAAPPAAPRAADPVPGPLVPRLPISLTDLSMKAVVDHIAGLDTADDEDATMQLLLDQGFPKARANEIMAMLRYKRVSQARRASGYAPQGNRGAGAIEFPFR